MKKEEWSVGNLGDGLPRQCEHWLAMTGAPELARNDGTKPFPQQAAAALPLEIGAIKNWGLKVSNSLV